MPTAEEWATQAAASAAAAAASASAAASAAGVLTAGITGVADARDAVDADVIAVAGLASAAADSASAAAADAASVAEVAPSANSRALIAALRNNACWPRPLASIAAGDTPTFTLGTAGAASTINGATTGSPAVLMTNSKIQFLGGASVQNSGTVPAVWRARGASSGATEGFIDLYASFEFQHTGDAFDLSVFGSFARETGNLRILVDDVIAGTTTVTWNSGVFYYLKVAFPTSRTRRIRVESDGGKFRGVNSASAADIAATGRSYPLATVIGDSFAEGTGAGGAFNGEAVAMLRALGLNVGLAAVGSTGLLDTNTAQNRVAWHHANRIKDLTLAGVTDALTGLACDPALGVVQMSLNDVGTPSGDWTPYGATLEAACENRALYLIDQWIAARTGKPLVFFGPLWPSGLPSNSPPLDLFRLRDATQQACWAGSRDNVWFIDRLMPAMREGVQSSATTQAYLYTNSDTTHPTPAGHAFDGLTTAAQLRSLILREFP